MQILHCNKKVKGQPQRFLGSGEEDFVCLTIYGHGGHLVNGAEPFELGMVAIWSMVQNHLNKVSIPLQ